MCSRHLSLFPMNQILYMIYVASKLMLETMVWDIIDIFDVISHWRRPLHDTANQLRAARCAPEHGSNGKLPMLADLSVPTIQRMEASDGVVRGNVDSLMKLISALENAGIE